MKRALVTGVEGQDGAYLSKLLLEKGYEVFGCTRQNASSTMWRMKELGIADDVRTVNFDLLEFSNILNVMEKIKPDEIYNLGALSFVASSFEQPIAAGDVNALGVARMLEAMRFACPDAHFYQASTSEMFGGIHKEAQSETTPFHPRSPYGVSKLYGHWITVNYRESYDSFATSGILFNHESPMRGSQFVTRKISIGFARIQAGELPQIALGNLNARRDWGHAADYVRGMWLMLNAEKPDDYVLASGENHSIRDFAEAAGQAIGFDLEWEGEGLEERGIDKKTGKTIVVVDPQFFRPAEVEVLIGDASKAETQLGWRREYSFERLVSEMVGNDCRRLSEGRL